MATVKFINYKPADIYVHGGEVIEIPHQSNRSEKTVDIVIRGFPQLYWSNGKPWEVGNFWLATFALQVMRGGLSLDALVSRAYALRHYMAFLEKVRMTWFWFPLVNKDKRCLFHYYHDLQGQLKRGEISYRSAKSRGKTAVNFYKAVLDYRLLSMNDDMFSELSLSDKVANLAGLERTIAVSKEQLKLRGAKDIIQRVEDGLVPLDYDVQDLILDIAFENCSPEVYLMLVLGFYTGMRVGTICDLKLLTLKYARPAGSGSFYYLSVGPSVGYAPVATKFGVNGDISIPAHVYDLLCSYVKSARRLKRAVRANKEDGQLVFLNKNGRSYCRKGRGSSSSVNSEVMNIRNIARQRGIQLSFKFHQTRATFGTNFVMENLDRPNVTLKAVIGMLKDMLLHTSERSTMTYIKYVQNHTVKAKWANEFYQRCKELQKKW
ncbi:site-specific integrase [Pseudomonas juntendi]|uniref:site-specific integrase n=1 Tax=Pseudomonas juntendi TaxID=2666183 RepID=UPI001F45A2AD|nr:site-specific integrase [Pseudomonas juntendi]